uniref:Golgi-specific brefeldin A-resistance guanine nucleotide exchange factor 1-like isoform X2 n=1 Tax=Styela clava TaxID=7725 RepID=UPI001939A364|nr:Golgi-specific brefeldin A-resistance guanine nucleotide exchange factor 1-like isoform X2 [Styela clava]
MVSKEAKNGGKYIVLSEVNIVVTSLRRNIRWASHGNQTDRDDPLIASFNNLKNALNTVNELNELEPTTFLSPFLEVIRSEDTSGPITGLALSTVNKFLTYNLIGSSSTVATAVSNMADAVTHARFVGTDPASDEVVLMKILQVLRSLLLSSVGSYLTNEAVCEIMQSCFRICFEMRLSELLRKSAEHTLVDMVQTLFCRIPEFKEDLKGSGSMKKVQIYSKLKMRAGGMTETGNRGKRSRKSPRMKRSDRKQSLQPHYQEQSNSGNSTPSSESHRPVSTVSIDSGVGASISTLNIADDQSLKKSVSAASIPDTVDSAEAVKTPEPSQSVESQEDKQQGQERPSTSTPEENKSSTEEGKDSDQTIQPQDVTPESPISEQNYDLSSPPRVDSVDALDELETQSQLSDTGRNSVTETEFVANPRGVRFTTSAQTGEEVIVGPLVPYGLPCVRELFRFLISLTNPHDRHNSDIMVHMGLSLLMVSMEVSRNEMERFPSLLSLVKDDMCRYLFQLLVSDRLSLVASSLRLSLLVFESLRHHLKFQLESFLKKLMELITSENPKMAYEVKELSIEAIVQLYHISGYVTELYLNYDCDLYCSNLFEDLSKLLSKNAFPVSGLYTTHLLSLDALLTVVESIEGRSNIQLTSEINKEEQLSQSSDNEENIEDITDHQTETVEGAEQTKQQPIIPPRFSSAMPNIEELIKIRHKKKLVQLGTEYFNQKPKKGVSFLQEQGLLAMPMDTREVVLWLRENPGLDKKMIGEFISDRRNPEILESFVRTFKFEGLRVDESLRLYLEAFRLPGEAPVIQRLIEAFSGFWAETNHYPFRNLDAGFTLSYAVIMLNTDQHNRNVRKQNEPMNLNQFRRNLKSCNGGEDFDSAMLEDIYNTIRHDEIVLPDEQTGPVRDRWLWNVSLRRGNTPEGLWLSAPPLINGPSTFDGLHLYDRDLFSMIWGPTVAALSFVFDKSLEEIIVQKSISGFHKCALISAHFGMCDVFDNLIISLCKFTTLTTLNETPEIAATVFGSNPKAQLAARTAFKLAHRHGDILREGWKNILDFMLPLFRAKLLPPAMVEVEDFVDPTGRISLIREELPIQRSDSSIFSSFYQIWGGGSSDNSNQKNSTPEDQQALKVAQECVKELHLEQLVTESKFLRLDSLQELIKALVMASRGPDTHESMGTVYSEDSAIFFLELLLRVVLQNRDRVLSIWQPVRDHLYTIVVTSSEYNLLLERAVVGLIRLAIRLLHREDVADQVLASLQILLMIKPFILPKVSRQIAYGLHELLRTNAANIHSRDDWMTCFTMMKCVGAGALPPPIVHLPTGAEELEAASEQNQQAQAEGSSATAQSGEYEEATQVLETHTRAQSDTEVTSDDRGSQLSDRGYTSDSELYDQSQQQQQKQQEHLSPLSETASQASDEGWVRLNRSDGELESMAKKGFVRLKLQNSEDKAKQSNSTIQVIPPPPSPSNQFTLQLGEELRQHDMRAMVKSCETLAFLVRDAAHITPENFELCVRCIRTFVEASINGVNRAHHGVGQEVPQQHKQQQEKKKLKKRKDRDNKRSNTRGSNAGMGQSGMGGRYGHSGNSTHSDDDSSAETVPGGYHTISLQLLDLMHTLHTRAASIYSSWAEEEKRRLTELKTELDETDVATETKEPKINAEASTLWDKCWCPLLQGIARLCCDARRQVRTSALTYLQRALLVHDLQTLTGKEWESCFNKVLFPLLTKLLENISPADPVGMEETRMRGATLLSKVFLQHLNPLLTLPTFTALWLTILDFMDKYMHVGKSDLLFEAIPESLKNMLLVMDTARIFHNSESPTDYTSLWDVTWERIDCFLPSLKDEVFKPPSPEPPKKELIAPTANELHRDGIPPSDVPHTYPYPVPPTASPPVPSPTPSSPSPELVQNYPVTGVISSPGPKVTPPASLNMMTPASPPINTPPMYPTSTVPSDANLPPSMSAPKAPIIMGLGGSLVPQQGYPGQQQPLSGVGSHGHILMSPTQNFILHPPAPSSTLSLQNQELGVINPTLPHPISQPQGATLQYPTQASPPLLLASGITPNIPIIAPQGDDSAQGYGGYNVPRKVIDPTRPLPHQTPMNPHIPASPLGQLPVTSIPVTLPTMDKSKVLKNPETY